MLIKTVVAKNLHSLSVVRNGLYFCHAILIPHPNQYYPCHVMFRTGLDSHFTVTIFNVQYNQTIFTKYKNHKRDVICGTVREQLTTITQRAVTILLPL